MNSCSSSRRPAAAALLRGGRLAALGVVVVVLSAAAAQQAQQDYRLRARAELVNVEVTVTDRRGEFVAGLKRENFRVLDEGAPQPITHFAALEAPAEVLVVVETTPAVYLIHRQHLAAAQALLEGLRAGDAVALAGYDQQLRLLLPFTRDKAAFHHALARLEYARGATEMCLFEALRATAQLLATRDGRKAVVLLSTGLDTAGEKDWPALEAALQASDVVIYPVALGGELREYHGTGEARPGQAPLSFEAADRALRRLAEVTGGEAFFPDRAEEFAAFYRRITAALRHQYSLGFPPPARDGRFHRLEVQVVDDAGRVLAPGRYRLRHRPGYLAPKD